MPTKEIKEFRKSGKIQEALDMAQSELQAQPDNIWAKRNISWVYYDLLKANNTSENFDIFLSKLTAIKDLQFPPDEKMLFDKLSWQIGMMIFDLLRHNPVENDKINSLFEAIQLFHFVKPSEGYSFLFKSFHKAFKESDKYIQFADWWNFENFRDEDYQKEKLPNGKEIMSIVEQAYLAYSRHLLPKQVNPEEVVFDKNKVELFLPMLDKLIEDYPQFQYPPYFKAKLLLAMGNKDNLLSIIIPFARKKNNDFWVWEILSEAFPDEKEKVFACYCKALSCQSPEEMLLNLRQRMASIFIQKKLFNEAKTEIRLLIETRIKKGFKIPEEVKSWVEQEWYKQSKENSSNDEIYFNYKYIAESILYSDVQEELVIIEFVNSDKKILNFFANESKLGFFKYDRFIKDVRVGDILKVRFQSDSNEGRFNLLTAYKTENDDFKKQFIQEIEGEVRINEGKSFGFVNDIYIHPSVVKNKKLSNGMYIKGLALKAFNKEKKQWGWKVLSISEH